MEDPCNVCFAAVDGCSDGQGSFGKNIAQYAALPEVQRDTQLPPQHEPRNRFLRI
jgi:hypothetical protein